MVYSPEFLEGVSMARKLSFYFTDAKTLHFVSTKEVMLDLGGDAIESAVACAIVNGICERSAHPFSGSDGKEMMLAVIADEKGKQLFCNVNNI